MIMFTDDVVTACQTFFTTLGNYGLTIAVKDIQAAYDGIVFHTDNGVSYKYWYVTKTVTKLEPWRSVKR